MKNEKNPNKEIKYQYSLKTFRIGFFIMSWSEKNIKKSPNANKIPPWPISPNMTPNKNGKEMI